MFLAMAENPATGSDGFERSGPTFCTLTWIGFLPDWMLDLVGEQNLRVVGAALRSVATESSQVECAVMRPAGWGEETGGRRSNLSDGRIGDLRHQGY